MILEQVDGEDAIVAQRGDELFAVGAFSTHHHGTFPKAWLSVKPYAVRGSMLVQSSFRRGAACSGARPDCPLACRKGAGEGASQSVLWQLLSNLRRFNSPESTSLFVP